MADGLTLPFQGMLRHSQAHCYYDRSIDAVDWASVSLPVDQLQIAGSAMTGGDLMPPRNPAIVTPHLHRIARLRDLHGQAAYLAEGSPDVLATPEVARGLEQALIHALVGCLDTADSSGFSFSQRSHQIIMRRFQRLLDENPQRPLYVPEVCAAIRVPERTLRLCCQEHLGMSPKQYLLLRRMQQARRALGGATAAGTTVTDIASRFGFWHFGRFAGCYRSLFGETPSATLRHAAGRG
jgi:AraC-like DNA-binding protein